MRKAMLVAGVCALTSASISACLSRPVASTEPHTSNLNVEPIRNDVIDKIDLLFVIDNSQSMGDKQALLAKAVPRLVERLIVPQCVNTAGATQRRQRPDELCPAGFKPEFRAASDIHVAVITSSLGDHGAPGDAICGSAPPQDDRAWLLPKIRQDRGLADYGGSGFLAWDPRQVLKPPGERDAARLGSQFGEMVKAAGENGCGYEATLESWYRFLIDPEPPLKVTVEGSRSVASGIDEELLAQRRAFLRTDSLVAIVMLTDENDCSVRDDGFGYRIADSRPMTGATSSCAQDPNSRCCLPCELLGAAPEGCTAPADDPACKPSPVLKAENDRTNLRCLRNKQRFGYDFLYPTSRYIQALTQPQVPRRSDGQLVENPLFHAPVGSAPRPANLIYLAGIVGVPWQDVADDDSRSGPGLRYLSASELTARDRWQVMLGDPANNQQPSDPFMQESTQPRSGQNPITGDAIAPATSQDPRQNAINGHEQVDVDGSDLQYACTFQLASPVQCTGQTSCDCDDGSAEESVNELPRNRPLCQPPTGGAAQTEQYFGKAYPGLRPLEVLKGIGDSAIVASICPKVLNEGQAGYGYEPAVDAIVDRLKTVLSARCLPRPLAFEASDGGKLPCAVVEAASPQLSPAGTCSCDAELRRSPASSAMQTLVRRQLAERRECDTATTPSCGAFCLCELAQAEGAGLDQCLNSEAGSEVPGYCYVNPFGAEPQGNPSLVADCDATSKQLIRFVGRDTPRPGATAFLACLGATLH